MADKKTYVVKATGYIHGEHRNKNTKVELTDREAKYLVTSGLVELQTEKVPEPEAKEPNPATLDRKTR